MSAKPRAKPQRRDSALAAEFERAVAELSAKMTRSPNRWSARRARRHFEQLYVHYVVAKVNGDRRKAVRVLDISMAGLKEKIRSDWTRK